MSDHRTKQAACVEVLERMSTKPPTTTREVGVLLAVFIPCFLDIVHRVADLSSAMFDSGGRVDTLLTKMEEHSRKEEDHLKALQALQRSPEETDSFKKFVKWFVERVLPNLVTAAITLAIAWVVTVSKLIPTP